MISTIERENEYRVLCFMFFLTYPIDVVGKTCPRAERTAFGTGLEALVNTATSTDSISVICQMTVWTAPALSCKANLLNSNHSLVDFNNLIN